MDSDYKAGESDIKTVMETRDLLPEGQQADSGDSAPSMGSVLFDLMGSTPRKRRKKGMKKALIAVLLFAGVLMVTNDVLILQASAAQTLDKDIELLREDIRSQVKQLVAANIRLTDAEAEKFWPVYDQYAAEMETINDVRISIIRQYAEGYNSLNDAEALSLTKRWMEADNATVQLAQKYLPLFGKVLPGRKVARFMQIDRRLRLLIDVQVSSQIPMVGEKLIESERSMPDHYNPGGAGTSL